jgi:heme iron utilization protein
MDTGDLWREATRLVAAQAWLALGTIDDAGAPSVTYVPFAPVRGAFGIVVSRLTAHTANLLARRPASVLLVDDVRPSDAYTRARFTVGVSVSPSERGSARSDAIWSTLEARQGATVQTLRELPDFEAVALEPVSGRLVLGFASAHSLDAEAIAEILRAAA